MHWIRGYDPRQYIFAPDDVLLAASLPVWTSTSSSGMLARIRQAMNTAGQCFMVNTS